ncbi:hypothetical protein NKR19_g6512 [Coniochaeta hoffmannii]|uniref:Uncharacterized protein n=1 Tax=Coniochaeta hoffmannii TaxID=91930 RepID=A0AA38RXM8_9PEZI|nr:hypothetical protein NKR19_g6512 [Coniochaeta hoffmannii]
MTDNPNKLPSSFIPTGASQERSNLHVQAMVMWMSAINGGHLAKPGAPDKAVDSLMASISNMSLDGLRASVPAAVQAHVPGFNQLTEDVLKGLVMDAAKMSVADEMKKTVGSQGENAGTDPRCWTNGTSFCSCYMPEGVVDGLFDEGQDVTCALDCSVGCSKEELAAAVQQSQREKYSPCCGEGECICTS